MLVVLKLLRGAAVATAIFVLLNMALTTSGFEPAAIGFMVWNLSPCVLAYLVVSRPSARDGSAGFAIATLALTTYFHFLWMFDIGKTQTGSSTSGLIFIFIPVYAVGLGLIGALLGGLVGRVISNLRAR